MRYIAFLDDDPDEFFMLQDAFGELNIPVQLRWFTDLASLCGFLETGIRLPDMLFLDINMSRQTGTECLQQLKANPKFSSLPVIIYTNSDYQQNIDNCFALGATVYLKKSSSFEMLKRQLIRILDWNLMTLMSLPPAQRTLLY